MSLAQDYTKQVEVISSGGGFTAGGNYSNFGVLGVTLAGYSQSGGNYYNSIGFIYTSDLITGIRELIETENLTVSPNSPESTAVIKYNLDQDSKVSVKIFNISGQQIQTLVNEVQTQGEQSVVLNTDVLKPGIYFCTLKTSEGMQTKKLIKLE